MLCKDYQLSVAGACRLVSISKSAYYYRPKKSPGDDAIKAYLEHLAHTHPRWGFEKMMLKVKSENKGWKHKRVYRLYCELDLNIRVKPKKRLPKGEAKSLLHPLAPNVCWSVDFMSDALISHQKFRTLNVIDDYSREGLLIKPSFSLPASKVTEHLDCVGSQRGYPRHIRIDNGPEFISTHFKKWAKQRGIELWFIQPGKPAQNGFVERFNRTYREDVLDMNWFHSLDEVNDLKEQWLLDYNQQRPHESLAGLAPLAFAKWRENNLNRIGEKSTFN